MIRSFLILSILSSVLVNSASAVDGLAPKPGEPRRMMNPGVRIEEKLGEQVPLDLAFRDENGAAITLGDCIGGKPTILVLAYFRCPMNCNDVLNGVVDAMREMPSGMTAGSAFNIVTVSFDEREQPDLAKRKRESYLESYTKGQSRPGAENSWHFLTGQKESIRKLTDAVGFRYVYDKVFKEYDHLSGIIILRPNGEVFRYFYGIAYEGEKDIQYPAEGGFKIGKTTLKMSLIEASNGTIGTLMDKLALRCFRFDHLEEKYSLNTLLAVRLGGALTLIGLFGMVFYFRFKERRHNALHAASASVQAYEGARNATPGDVDSPQQVVNQAFLATRHSPPATATTTREENQ